MPLFGALTTKGRKLFSSCGGTPRRRRLSDRKQAKPHPHAGLTSSQQRLHGMLGHALRDASGQLKRKGERSRKFNDAMVEERLDRGPEHLMNPVDDGHAGAQGFLENTGKNALGRVGDEGQGGGVPEEGAAVDWCQEPVSGRRAGA